MRNRLIELISKLQYLGGLEEKVADSIIADGWIRPPCKVGDKLYVIEGSCRTCLDKSDYCHRGCKKPKRIVSEVTINQIRIYERKIMLDECDALASTYDWFGYADEFGKTVFLTKEEAEEKLKELNDNVR